MATPITLKPHLTTEELYRRYRRCRVPQEKTRWRALHLISGGMQASEAARRVGRSSGWITLVARRYNTKGAEAVTDGRTTQGRGRKPHLDTEAARALDTALRSSPADGGLWTAPKVARWIEARTGIRVPRSTAWRYMQRLGFTLQVPRPRHRQRACEQAQAAFKKSLVTRSSK
jgi:transposase